MDWLSGQIELDKKLGLNVSITAGGEGLSIDLNFSNLNSKRENNLFPEYDIISIPSITVMYSSEDMPDEIYHLITSEVPLVEFFNDNGSTSCGNVINLKPEDTSQHLIYACIIRPDSWHRMMEIARKVGILNLELVLSFSMSEKTSILPSKTILFNHTITIPISKANLEKFIDIWTKMQDYVRDLPDSLPEEVLNGMIEASKCIDVEASKAAVVMSRRALQKALLLKGADKSLPLFKQIDNLKDNNIVSSDIASLAHGIRYLGNSGAHPDGDLLNNVSFEDAKLAYQVTLKILKQLFHS